MVRNDLKLLTNRYLTYLETTITDMRENYNKDRRMLLIVICALAGVNVSQFVGWI